MQKSNNERVQKFLEEVMEYDDFKFQILQKLRQIVFKLNPKVTERMMYGGIMFTLDDDFGGIFASKKHVSFEFSNGYLLRDSKKLLEGVGKYRRHLKIESLEDIKDKDVEFFVDQVV